MASTLSFISRRLYRIAIYLNVAAVLGINFFSGLSSPTSAAQVLAASTASVCLQTTNVYNAGEHPYALDLGDVNGDGKLDLAIANRSYSYISVEFGNGSGGFLSPVSYSVGYLPVFVQFGDINGDGKLDLATANESGNTASVLINNGNGTFGSATNYSVGLAPQAVAMQDMNEDGFPDLIVTNRDSNSVSVLLNKGSGTFYAPVNYSVGPAPMRFDVGDINKDGHLDIVVSSASSTRATVLLGNGTGSFGSPSYSSISNTIYGSNAVMLADLNGDSKLDLIATTGGGNTTSIALGNGSGGFGLPVEYPVGSDPLSISIGDLDGDGISDILVANWYSYYISVLSGNGDGTFETAFNYPVGLGSNFAIMGDLNSDERTDIVIANHSPGTVTVMLGQAPDLTPPTGSIAINQGAPTTTSPNVTLNLAAQDVGCGVASMAFSTDGVNFTPSETYATTKAWSLLPGDGTKTVYVKFKDRADNVSQVLSATIVLDQTAPTPGTVTVNNGAAYTTSRNVTLGVPASDSGTGVRYMYISDGLNSSGWVSYTKSLAWSLPSGDGGKTITVRWRDLAGNISAPATATITLDTLPPSVAVTPLTPYQVGSVFPVTVSGSDATSGIASYDVEFRDGASGAWTGWLTETTSTTANFTGQDGHSYSFRARARDNAGNTGALSPGDATTTVDLTTPVVNHFMINFGALQTTGVTVSLSLGASDTTSGVAAMSFSNDGMTWSDWQPYATTAIWSLGAGDGEKTVFARFRDAAGNISSVASDSIVLNTFVGTEYGVTINNGALFTNQTSVTLTLGAHLGTMLMQVSNDGGFAGAVWEPYSGQKAWQISQYGTYVLPRVVYLRFKDQNGIVSSTYQDDIILDVLPPQGQVSILPPSNAPALAAAGVTLKLTASDDVSGVAGMRLSNQPNFAGASWEPYASTRTWNLGSGTSVYVQFRDYAGNISQAYVASQQTALYLPMLWR